ncbi:hypothetical protein FB451DRAFT_1169955 [Mycena latifolia]|nr:hypothetical protein FB451DRAFT_1169955 [Mycena latifolia]
MDRGLNRMGRATRADFGCTQTKPSLAHTTTANATSLDARPRASLSESLNDFPVPDLRCCRSPAQYYTKTTAQSSSGLQITHTLPETLGNQCRPRGRRIDPIQSVEVAATGRLVDLDDRIAQVRGLLKELEEERAAVLSLRAQNSGVLSPLRRMPPEILAEIFSWTLPSITEALERGFDVRSSPWVLGQTSSFWRAVALSTPSLWSLIAIDYSASVWCPLPMLETQIARARNLKVTIYGCKDADSLSQVAVFRSLAERSSLWEELSVGLISDMVPIIATLRNRIPSLRRLWISWNDSENLTAADLSDAFHTAPSLLEAGFHNGYHLPTAPFPMHHLIWYRLNATWTIHAGILKLAQNLVEACLAIFGDEPWPEDGDIIE